MVVYIVFWFLTYMYMYMYTWVLLTITVRTRMRSCSSGVIWEERKKKKRYKALCNKQSFPIEKAYNHFVTEVSVGKKPHPKVKIDPKLEVRNSTPRSR